jgi:trigger factor
MDDELALLVGDYDSLEDLRAGAREQMETEALQKAESEYLDKVLDAFIESANALEYPPQAVDREVEMALGQMESSLASSGLQLDVYLGMIGTTREAYGQELRPVAETRLKRRLVLAEIVEQEGLEAEPEEIDAEVERMLESMGPEAGEMRETLSGPGSRALLANDVVTSKAQELAVQIAKGEAPPVEKDEPEEAEVEGDAEVVEAEEKDAEAETEPEVEDLAEEPEVEPEAPVEEPVSEEPEDEDEGN